MYLQAHIAMSEQPSVVQQAEEVVNKVAASVAETLNFGKEEPTGNPGESSARRLPPTPLTSTCRPAHPLH